MVQARSFSAWVHNDFAGFHQWAKGNQRDNKPSGQDQDTYPDAIGWGHRAWEENAFPVERHPDMLNPPEGDPPSEPPLASPSRGADAEARPQGVASNQSRSRRAAAKERAGFTKPGGYQCLGGEFVLIKPGGT